MLRKVFSRLYRASVVFAWLLVGFLLSGATGTKPQIVTFCLLLAALVFWALWPIVTERTPDQIIHDNQQASLKRFHKMQARDRNEPIYTKWWKPWGVKP